MIKLFRNVRRKMLIENKFGAYFGYAVGEIFLVIIGILIALAINEHSKNKSNLELRDHYILQLNQEADRNIKELNILKDGANKMLKDLDTLLQLISMGDFDNQTLALKSFVLIESNKFYPIMITYENLKFSGDLKLFDDLNLRNSISEAYKTFYPIERFELLDHQGIATYYENFLMPKVRFRYMGMTTGNYGKEVYFENMVLSRITTIMQNQTAYENSIESLKNLKNTFARI